MSDETPREWTLYQDGLGIGAWNDAPQVGSGKRVQVIEMSAYEAMKKRAEEAEQDFGDVHAHFIKAVDDLGILQDRVIEAEAKLKIAKDALEEIESHTYSKSPCGIAEKTLEKLK